MQRKESVLVPLALAVLNAFSGVRRVDERRTFEVGDSAGPVGSTCCPLGDPDFLDKPEHLLGWCLRRGRPDPTRADQR